MRLQQDTLRLLQTAIQSAYPSRGDLRLFVKVQLGQDLEHDIAEAALPLEVLDLIRGVEARGMFAKLVLALIRERPENPDVVRLGSCDDVRLLTKNIASPRETRALIDAIEDAGIAVESILSHCLAMGIEPSSHQSVGELVRNISDNYPTTVRTIPILSELSLRLASALPSSRGQAELVRFAEAHAFMRRGISQADIRKHWQHWVDTARGPIVLSVLLEDGESQDECRTYVWLHRENAELGGVLVSDDLGIAPIARLVGFIGEFLGSSKCRCHLRTTAAKIRIEIIAPLRVLMSPIPGMRSLIRTHTVVMRCRERVNDEIRCVDENAWNRKTSRCFFGDERSRWRDAKARLAPDVDWEDRLCADSCVALAIPFSPESSEHHGAHIDLGVRAGLPVMVWLTGDAPQAESLFDALLSSLPQSVLTSMNDAIQAVLESDMSHSCIGNVVLLYDRADRLPPHCYAVMLKSP